MGNKGWCRGENSCLLPVWPGFKSQRQRHMWFEFVLVLSFAPRGFLQVLSFSPLLKNQFSNSNSSRNQVDEEPLCGCATSKSLFLKKINFIRKVKRIKHNKTFILNLGHYIFRNIKIYTKMKNKCLDFFVKLHALHWCHNSWRVRRKKLFLCIKMVESRGDTATVTSIVSCKE